ncbi:MAG TPA: carbon-nitrogen hydrolase family protein [Aminivibrio sp.]|uniref:carbon-nitrogen hydrolase family protein n=1 Tax=Aminivibrio sp. TaxID=1872489 RepID=UPI002C530547|nr:carbon-nitrogen hydrolase family protein [Aminivibrio sp.]HPF85665.1 carbon-nitrogen hydrolase family protein [Aminivibrio sp.]
MGLGRGVVRAAVVQAAPAIMDRRGTLERIRKLTEDAAGRGARIILFPEAFIPCYPRGLSFGSVVGNRSMGGRKDWARYYENSIDVPGPETEELGKLAAKSGAYLSIGVMERDGGTLFCTLLYFGPDGSLLAKHRKLKPTGSERLIWGEGDGSTLAAVETPYGTMSGLICWENYMPLARAAVYGRNPSIYLAPTADQRDGWQCSMRHIALEGRCFVLSCNQFVTKEMYPSDLACFSDLEQQPEVMSRGGSAIIDPLGNYVAGPLWDKEGILVADLDLEAVVEARYDFDVMGHYARPDVFTLLVDDEPRSGVEFSGDASAWEEDCSCQG